MHKAGNNMEPAAVAHPPREQTDVVLPPPQSLADLSAAITALEVPNLSALKSRINLLTADYFERSAEEV